MILVEERKDGRKVRSYTVRGFSADFEAKMLVLMMSDGSFSEKRFSSFDHNHVTGSDYHILTVEVAEC